MKIDLYTLCWNEIDILPFVVDYWKRFVTQAYVYDNGSTDGSVDYLRQFDWIEVRHFDTEGMNDDVQRGIKNSCWKESKGKADWVIVCDMDEVIYSQHMAEELQYMKDNGYNILGTPWYALCGESKPVYKEGVLLHQIINRAYKQDINRQYNDIGKFMLFDPNVITDMNYEVGCHEANPKPSFKLYKSNKIYAIHFDKGFGVEYMIERRKLMNDRLSQTNKDNKWCFEYGLSEDEIIKEYESKIDKSFNLLNVINEQNNNVNIFIGTQKTFTPAVKNNAYKIIVGNHEIENNSNLELIKCKHDSILDDRFYSELYMLDYISKNVELPQYVGFCHNRRYFSFLDDIPNMDEIFSEYDAICAKPKIFEASVKEQYAFYHNIEDLYIIGGIIAEKYPEQANMWKNFINGNIFIPYNMFIMKREDFKEYIDFIFSILDEYLKIVGTDINKRIDDNKDKYLKNFYPNNTVEYQYRIGGYIAERLTNLFMMYKFKKIKTYPVMVTENKYNLKNNII